MNLDMTQFGATQNQKQAQANTLLWGKHIKFQPCLAGARVRSSKHKVMDRSFYYNENDRDISRFSWLRKTMDDGYYTYVEIRLMSTLSLTIVYRDKTSNISNVAKYKHRNLGNTKEIMITIIII